MEPQTPYNDGEPETPLERAARADTPDAAADRADAQAEHEANVVIDDIDRYVAQTDPAGLPEAEAALDAWQIPTSPLEGVPADVALDQGQESEPLVEVFSAGSEFEANIVRGVLESEGIAAVFRVAGGPSIGSVFSISEGRWADILVAARQADAARAVIAAAQSAPAAKPE